MISRCLVGRAKEDKTNPCWLGETGLLPGMFFLDFLLTI